VRPVRRNRIQCILPWDGGHNVSDEHFPDEPADELEPAPKPDIYTVVRELKIENAKYLQEINDAHDILSVILSDDEAREGIVHGANPPLSLCARIGRFMLKIKGCPEKR
jgi:hypothetical protein